MPYRSFMPVTSTEFVAAAGSATVASGRRLRLYEAMASLGSITPLRLAIATRTSVWFIDGWLQAQARAGYAVYDASTDSYRLATPDTPDPGPSARYAASWPRTGSRSTA